MLSHAVKQSLAFHGFIQFVFTNSQCWSKIKKKSVLAVDLVWEGGEQKLPIIFFLERKKFQPVKVKQLPNNIKSEQKGNKILCVFHFHYFVVK